MLIRFHKEETHRWYADIPTWKGSKADLEMVMGADTMLDIISQGEGEVVLSMSTEFIEGSDVLQFVSLTPEIGEGAYYLLKEWKGIEFNLKIWLCDVTKFVFGNFPNKIYIV